MSLTEHRQKLRAAHITATDVPKILMGQSWDVWLKKTGKVEEGNDDPTEAMRLGNLLEGPLLDYAQKELGPLVRNQFRVHTGGILAASHDALVKGKDEGVEAKTAGVVNPRFDDSGWGEPGTDEVPDRYVLSQAQAAVSNLEVVHMPAWVRGKGEVMYHVPRDPELVEIILERITVFWDRHVQGDIPPDDGSFPTIEVARMVVRVQGKSVALADDLIARWQRQKAAMAKIKELADTTESQIHAALIDAQIGQGSDCMVKMIEGTSNWVDRDALQAESPEIYQRVLRTKKFRYPRIVKNQKKGRK